jgi:hypothetical protein
MPELFMEKTFYHHWYFFALAKRLPHTTFGLVLICWLPMLFLFLSGYHGIFPPLFRLTIVCTLTIIFIALLAAMILNELCNTAFLLTDNSIIKKMPYKTLVIHFDHIIKFRYIKIPVLKGYGKISVKGGGLRLPFIIDNLPECIDSIRHQIDAFGNSGVYDEKNLMDFQLKATVHEISVQRLKKTANTLSQIIFGSIVGSAIISRIFWDIDLRGILCWSLFGIFFPIMGYIISGILLYRKTVNLQKQSSTPLAINYDDCFIAIGESKIYRITGSITGLVYAITGIVFKNLI